MKKNDKKLENTIKENTVVETTSTSMWDALRRFARRPASYS